MNSPEYFVSIPQYIKDILLDQINVSEYRHDVVGYWVNISIYWVNILGGHHKYLLNDGSEDKGMLV